MKHFIILTMGEFDDYDISGLYASENPINKSEWDVMMREFNWHQAQKHHEIYKNYNGTVGYAHIPEAHDQYLAWVKENHPWNVFKTKNNLVKLDYTELWTWGSHEDI